MSQEILEGEIVDGPRSVSRGSKSEQPKPFKFPGWRLLATLIPVFGLAFAITWFYYERSKKSPLIVFAIAGIIMSIFTTTTFLVIRFILKSVF